MPNPIRTALTLISLISMSAIIFTVVFLVFQLAPAPPAYDMPIGVNQAQTTSTVTRQDALPTMTIRAITMLAAGALLTVMFVGLSLVAIRAISLFYFSRSREEARIVEAMRRLRLESEWHVENLGATFRPRFKKTAIIIPLLPPKAR